MKFAIVDWWNIVAFASGVYPHNVNLIYYTGITDTILLFQWLFPNSEQAKNFVSRYKVARCIFATILANFSPIFRIFFFLKGYEKSFRKQAQTVVLVVSVLQAPLGDFLAWNEIFSLLWNRE